MTSIREVAKLAGVSPSTVSRVINDTVNVDSEKKRRVLQVIQETGFIPNELARSLYKKSSKIIGVIVPTIENLFFNEIAKAIEEEAYLHGYRFTLCNSNNNYEKEIANIRVMTQLHADGIVLMTNNEQVQEEIQNCRLPIVILDRGLEARKELAHIHSDHYKGGRIAMEHMIACGCRHIVNLRGSQSLSSGRQRFKGYADVCQEHGIEVRYVECSYDYEAGLSAAAEVLTRFPDTDGIIASNDMVAIAVYKYLHNNGIRVPEDIQLIGFDNISLSRQHTPELTTVSQQITDMGTLAARLIIDHVEGRTVSRSNVFGVQLIQRETTKKISER